MVIKMKIKVIGKAHMEGISKKTNRAYNFNVVHYVGSQRGVEGEAGQQIMLDPTKYPISNILVGMTYSVDFDNHGYPVDFLLSK
jgi:hypothetical protein